MRENVVMPRWWKVKEEGERLQPTLCDLDDVCFFGLLGFSDFSTVSPLVSSFLRVFFLGNTWSCLIPGNVA